VYQLLASLRALLTGAGKLEEELAHVVQHVLSILGAVAGLPWIAQINVSRICIMFCRVADPHLFNADPDPVLDPGFSLTKIEKYLS
jgi:hypothetical protein